MITDDCPGIEQLQEALQPLAPENDALSAHLAACPCCRASLEALAGESSWWDFAGETLAEPISDATLRITASVCALSVDLAKPMQDGELLDHELQQLEPLLGPACHPDLIGSLGRYELEQLVGRGGMGLVFRAFDSELHRIVAVKTLAVHLIPIHSARERFVRESRASAALVHPHIVPVHDVITEGPVPAIVMQYIAGPTLEQYLEEHGPLDWKHALEIANQIADALAAAHDKGLVHRDVKPGNVLLEADGSRALLSDFGLVRALDDATLTRSGILAGTPDYMSPEQAHGKTVGFASDLFSLGSVMFFMLSGKPPFQATGPMAIMNKVCHERHPSMPAEFKVPPKVTRLVDRLLNKDPSRRPAGAQQVAEQIRTLIVTKHRPRSKPSGLTTILTFTASLAIVLVLVLWNPWTSDGEGTFHQLLERGAISDSGNRMPPRVTPEVELRSVYQQDTSLLDHGYLDERIRNTQQDVDQLFAEMQRQQSGSFRSDGPDAIWEPVVSQLQSVTQALNDLEADFQRRPGSD